MGDKKSPTRPKRQPKPSSDEGYWDCSVCTFRNSAEAFKCMMCDVRKGTSTRSTFFEVIVNASRTKEPLKFPISGRDNMKRPWLPFGGTILLAQASAQKFD
ncbi:YY1 associated factor 2 [Rhinolophus ferrumequinum]|uniref:YY1 associated factor 2 n=1 Tax=Rhinolophus ferrumequinum TaxID=59479 RepID=A0A7J7WU15_RHIFE|nr:YY1 associated factor 2 [Rhinolophus ferrumequinum]